MYAELGACFCLANMGRGPRGQDHMVQGTQGPGTKPGPAWTPQPRWVGPARSLVPGLPAHICKAEI